VKARVRAEVELREEKEKSEEQAREKDSAIFEHPSSGTELRKEEMAGQEQ